MSKNMNVCWLLFSAAEDEEEEEIVHMGNAIMSFYSALIDLLGRCAPEMHVSGLDLLIKRYKKYFWRSYKKYS